MKYAVWFVRLVYAALMIPAGLNHFIRLYPQPIGNQPLSIEVFTALLDSGLFTLVKAVELLAGIAVLAVLTVAANALLMLACLPAYRGVLEGGERADGEAPEAGRNYESLFVDPLSGAPPTAYLGGAAVLAAALAFYWFVVPFSNGTTGLVTLAVPTVLLLAGWARALSRRKDA